MFFPDKKFYLEVILMKNTVCKVLALVMCALLVSTAFVACGEKTGNEEFVIGMSGPLTGGASVYGIAVKNSAQMAVEEINAAGGLDGVMFKLEALDDQHDASKVATNYAALMDEGMVVSLGCVTSAPGLEFTKLSAEDNVFFLTPSASANAIVDARTDDQPEDLYTNGYQMCFADGNQGTVAADYVNGLTYDTIGIFYKSDDPYSKGIYDMFMETLRDDITVVESSFTGEATDFTTQIEALKDCKFIFMPIYYTPASSFMTQAKDKVAADAIYYGCDGFDGIESAEGFDITTIPQAITMLSHFNSKATEGAAAEYIQKYTEKFGKETLNQFGASAYDCIYAIYNAMKTAKAEGKTITPDMDASDLCEILKEKFNGGFTYSGNTGDDIKWDSTGYVAKTAIAYEIKGAN